VGDATTAGRIGVLRSNYPVCRLSAAPYDGHRSRPGSEPRLLSQSTRGRRDRNYGSRTIGWPTNWVERMMIISSSATSPCSSPTPPLEPDWSTCLRGRSPTGMTWSKPSPAISKARTCALETPGISEAAASSGRVSSGLHPAILEAAHRAAQRHRFGCHRHVPRRHHLPRPGEQAGSQDPHQGERADGHRHQVRLRPGGS
jgi:hypothetical protein